MCWQIFQKDGLRIERKKKLFCKRPKASLATTLYVVYFALDDCLVTTALTTVQLSHQVHVCGERSEERSGEGHPDLETRPPAEITIHLPPLQGGSPQPYVNPRHFRWQCHQLKLWTLVLLRVNRTRVKEIQRPCRLGSMDAVLVQGPCRLGSMDAVLVQQRCCLCPPWCDSLSWQCDVWCRLASQTLSCFDRTQWWSTNCFTSETIWSVHSYHWSS